MWQGACDRCTDFRLTLQDLYDLGLLHAVLHRQGAVFWSWLLRKDGGTEGRVVDTGACVDMVVCVCTGVEICGVGWLRHWASPIGSLLSVDEVGFIDAMRV